MLLLWLESKVSTSSSQRYRHQVVVEQTSKYEEGLQELIAYVYHAHEDARTDLRKLADISLDPLGSPPAFDPAQGYPEQLDDSTLKGYLGEIFAGLIIEHFAPFGGTAWKVPVFLFRFHQAAFDLLEGMRAGKPATPIPGRLGNDCLGFQFDEQGKVTHVLCAEAKCSGGHSSAMIAEAHIQISEVGLVSLPAIIKILSEYDDPLMQRWADGIRHLWFTDPSQRCERYDLVAYVCGTHPRQNTTWLSPIQPHRDYQGGRWLEAVEVHLNDVAAILQQVYPKQSGNSNP